MKCEEVHQFLDLYLDGEFDAQKRLELEQHLSQCPECQRLLEEQRKFRAYFRANAPQYKAPAELTARLTAKMERERRRLKLIELARQPWLYAAALLILCLSLGWQILFPNRETPLVSEAALAHSRAVLLQRLCDVVSANPDVVQEWLTAKLGFAPPVVRPANPEFQMRGGRVDVIQNRKVAALVYKRDKDLVTLFVWPAASKPIPARDLSISGYQACTWNAAGYNFIAISTLSDHDLDEFIDQIKDQLKS